jgi:hypothetical protein
VSRFNFLFLFFILSLAFSPSLGADAFVVPYFLCLLARHHSQWLRVLLVTLVVGGDELPGGLGVVIVETLQLEKTQ